MKKIALAALSLLLLLAIAAPSCLARREQREQPAARVPVQQAPALAAFWQSAGAKRIPSGCPLAGPAKHKPTTGLFRTSSSSSEHIG